MTELLQVLGQIASEFDAAEELTALGALLLVAKYSVDLMRTELIQRGLAGIETAAKLRPGALQWRAWSDRTRVIVTMAQSFLVGLLGSVMSGMSWGAAAGSAVIAAIGAKGLHDSGLLPGRRPSPRGAAPAIDRQERPRSVSRDIGRQPKRLDDDPTDPDGRPAIRVPGSPSAKPPWRD